MNHLPNRTKLRREYLRKKVTKHLYAGFGVVTFLCGYAVVCMMRHPILDSVKKHPDLPTALKAIGGTAIVLVSYLLILRIAHKMIWLAQSMAIDYVPPITPDTLPADEVLVRGSEEPFVAQSKMLLRASKDRSMREEELLRVSHREF